MTFDRVLVAGLQRSGTRFMAKVMAEWFDWNYFSEDEVQIADFNKVSDFFSNPKYAHGVLQCPSYSCNVQAVPDNVLVVYMVRDPDDVRESDKSRIDRQGYTRFSPKRMKFERPRSVFIPMYDVYMKHYKSSIPVELHKTEKTPEIAHYVWRNLQKSLMSNYVEVNYEDLKEHPKWIDKEDRRKFATGVQTS